MAIMARVTWGCEPDEVSMLHAVRYVKAAGGIGPMLDVKGGAQQDRFPAGTQQIASRMADDLGDRVRLGSVVERIEHGPDGVTVHTATGAVAARAVVVAIPPAHRATITFDPGLPAGHAELARHWPQGNLSKAYAAYETPFWRTDGQSGEALSDDGPVFITFDVSPDDDGPGVLLGFTDARTFDPLEPDVRRTRALRCFADLFGDAALHPSTTSTTVGAPSPSRREVRRPRYRPVRGPPTGTGCANRWTASSGREPRPPTSGRVSSTARCGRGTARPPRSPRTSPLRADPALRPNRFDEGAQLLVDLVRMFQRSAVAAGQLDE